MKSEREKMYYWEGSHTTEMSFADRGFGVKERGDLVAEDAGGVLRRVGKVGKVGRSERGQGEGEGEGKGKDKVTTVVLTHSLRM